MRNVILAIIIVAGPLAAQDRRGGPPPPIGPVEFSHAPFNPQALTGSLVIADPAIGVPRRMIALGQYLWVMDKKGDPYIHVIDLMTNKLVQSYGRRGEGPGDFRGISNFSVRPGEADAVWAFDGSLRRLTLLHGPPSRDPPVTIDLRPAGLRFEYQWLGRDQLVSIGEPDSTRFAFAAQSGEVRRRAGTDLIGPDSIPWLTRRDLATQVQTCASPALGRFAVLYTAAGRVEIHDQEGRLVALAKVPFPSTGDFYKDDRGWHWRSDRRYYVGCAATPSRLYAFFDGVRGDTPEKRAYISAEYVHIFDWQGQLLGVLKLDHKMETIAVVADTALYAAGVETDGVFRYRIPPMTTPRQGRSGGR